MLDDEDRLGNAGRSREKRQNGTSGSDVGLLPCSGEWVFHFLPQVEVRAGAPAFGYAVPPRQFLTTVGTSTSNLAPDPSVPLALCCDPSSLIVSDPLTLFFLIKSYSFSPLNQRRLSRKPWFLYDPSFIPVLDPLFSLGKSTL